MEFRRYGTTAYGRLDLHQFFRDVRVPIHDRRNLAPDGFDFVRGQERLRDEIAVPVEGGFLCWSDNNVPVVMFQSFQLKTTPIMFFSRLNIIS